MTSTAPSFAGLALAFALAAGTPGIAPAQPVPWAFGGANLLNSHAVLSHPGVTQLNTGNIARLNLKWKFTPQGSISATPTVEQGGLYVPDWSGYLYKIDPDTGALLWRHAMSDYTGLATSRSRSSPAIAATSVVFGDRSSGSVIAVSKATGALLWHTVVDQHPSASVNSAPVIYNDTVYVGVASSEEVLADTTSYVPTFRGSVAALNLSTGKIVWQFKTVPNGYAGGGVWGSSPAVSVATSSLFVGTGNNYKIPAGAADCLKHAAKSTGAELACLDVTDYVDALLALDLATGKLKWTRRLQGADTWTTGCLVNGKPGCPNPEGKDADFGAAPNLIQLGNFVGVPDDRGGSSAGVMLGAGQKNGVYWALNPVNGGLFWGRKIAAGEIVWGTAVDISQHQYVFAPMSNNSHQTQTLAGRNGIPQSWNGGAWTCLDAHTGQIVWQVPTTGTDLVTPTYGADAPGGMSFTNGLVFAGDTGGHLTAFSATGLKKWSYATGVSVVSAPAIFNDVVFWGVGYPRMVPGTALYAFAVP